MKPTTCGEALKQFFKRTTLHGFKYLTAEYYSDRFCWAICCGASACCAGVLCAVLWARFQEVPALLTMQELTADHYRVSTPILAVCTAAHVVANNFIEHAAVKVKEYERLPIILESVMRRKPITEDQITVLNNMLEANNLTLTEALFKFSPPCGNILSNCRWQNKMMPCATLFEIKMTLWGPCCIYEPSKFNMTYSRMEVATLLELAMTCSNSSTRFGCEFFTKYDIEPWVHPTPLAPGFTYMAQLSFTAVMDTDPDNLLEDECILDLGYTITYCLMKCIEKACGCADPLSGFGKTEHTNLPLCSIPQINCLRTFKYENACNCLPSCIKMNTYMSLESSRLNALEYTFDKLFSGLNKTTATVLSIRLRYSSSRLFSVKPTETWITLLSSLGGVFNMFLGVGLFSALEVLFLILVTLPIAFRRSSEITPSE